MFMKMLKTTNRIYLPRLRFVTTRNFADSPKQEGISLNQFIASPAAEKLSALRTAAYLKERARRGSRKGFDGVLAKIPDVPPPEWDQLSEKDAERIKDR